MIMVSQFANIELYNLGAREYAGEIVQTNTRTSIHKKLNMMRYSNSLKNQLPANFMQQSATTTLPFRAVWLFTFSSFNFVTDS
jgi:hypothetical protein